MWTYQADKEQANGLESHLSAEWDTRRDAALAAKLKFDLTYNEYRTLLETGHLRTGTHTFKLTGHPPHWLGYVPTVTDRTVTRRAIPPQGWDGLCVHLLDPQRCEICRMLGLYYPNTNPKDK